MDFLNWRSTEYLMQLMDDTLAEYRVRIRAGSILYRRFMKPCATGCGGAATTTWATVPVCHVCRTKIEHEQADYYERRRQSWERDTFGKIEGRMPWRQGGKSA